MKKSFLKSLSFLAALVPAISWGAELVIPYSFDGKEGNTEYAYEYQVQMPDEDLTSFTTTIRYSGGSHRVEILGVKLLDGETEYTAVATGTEGTEVAEAGSYSGGNNYHNVFTFTNEEGFTANKVYTLQANLKVTNNPPSHNGNIKISGGITLYVPPYSPYSFGVNFTTNANQNISTTEGAGFSKGTYAKPITWGNFTGSANGNGTMTVEGQTLKVYWTSRGTYYSDADISTDDGKLLKGYLDDTVNNGRTKATVTITGLPSDKQYAVALILSGDASGTGFNTKYSPALINGEIYSYADGTLVKGDDAKAATTWGDRRQPGAGGPTTPTEGQNVMFVEGLSGSILTITSAMDAQNTSRLTIAGVQVWTTEDTPVVTPPEDKEVISLNFYSSQGGVSGAAGLVSAQGWENLAASGTETSLAIWNGGQAVDYPISLTYSSANGYQYTNGVTDNYIKGYLDDGGNQAQVTVENIPFEEYSVIVYSATDTADRKFKPVLINGTYYAGAATPTAHGYANVVLDVVKDACSWGGSRNPVAAYGTNALRVDGLTASTLTIKGGSNGDGARGGIAAVQIVNTGDSILSDVQKIDWTEQPTEDMKVSELPELTKTMVELTLPAGATLIVDTALPEGHSIAIKGDNVTVNITNWDIDKSTVEAVVSGATVTTAYTDTIGVEIDGVTYSYFFRGTNDANYHTVANWYTGKRVMGDQTKWYSVSGDVAPGVGGNMWHHILLDGDMMDPTNVTVGEDGYKTISANTLEGWNLGYFVRNGVHLNVATLNKIQNGGGFTAVWRVDDTSKITIGARGNSAHNNLANYYIDNEEGIVFTEFDIADANYYFDEDGSVKLDGVSGTQTIKAVTLDLGTVAEGRTIVSRKLIGFNSSSATYTVDEGAVTTSVETVAATEAVSLRTVGDYKFEQKEDGYYVNFVAYAETDDIGETSTWTATEDTNWVTEGNWTWGVPAAGADAVISITEDTTIIIPDAGVSVGLLTVNGEGTLTIAGGKITAEAIVANTSIVANETLLALAPMNIAEGKTVTYTTTTMVVDADAIGNVNHALSLKAMTGAGTFVKKGAGVIGLFATDAEPAIIVEEGALYVREAPTTAMNVAAKAGAEIRLAAWQVNFANNANKITLDGGAQLTLANGANVSGTITIANAAETAAKICGSSFNAATIAAAITGAGKVEFADGGSFGDATKYPCNNATTYTGVISSDLQVIISDTSAITFSGTNTYTGGTTIAAGVTLNAGTNSLGTGAVTGAGKLVVAGYPSNETVRNSLGAAEWTGRYVNTADNQMADTGNWFGAVGNENSEVEFAGASTGYLAPGGSSNFDLIVSGSITFSNGNSGGNNGYTFNGALLGEGTLATQNSQTDVLQFLGETKDFAGTITVAGGHCIAFGEQADDGTAEGKLVVAAGKTANIAADKTWTAVNGIEVAGTIGGEGTIGSELTLLSNATIDATASILTANGAVNLPDTIKVVLNELEGTDTLILKATNITSATMPMATIVVDGNEVATIRVEKREDGLYLPMKQTYTRTFDGTSTTWVATGAWTIDGTTTTVDEPLTQSDVAVTVNADTVVTHTAKLHLASLKMAGEGVLTLVMDLSTLLTRENYLASPYTFDLIEVDAGMDLTHLKVQTTGAKYGAFVRVTTTESKISATVTLPESMIVDADGKEILSINFASGRNGSGPYNISSAFGYEDYEVPAVAWTQLIGKNHTNVDVIAYHAGGATSTLPGALKSVTSADPWSVNGGDMDATLDIFKGYLDDGTAPNIQMSVPSDWATYTAIIYCMTDGANVAFSPKTVNGIKYTYNEEGDLVADGATGWGNSSSNRGQLVEGTNVMVIPNLQGDFSLVSPRENGRGCIAGFQLVQTGEYDLSRAPKVYTATLTADVAWANIAWTKPEGATADAPTAYDLAEITLGASVTVDMTGATASQVTVMGQNQTLCLENLDGLTMPWVFDTNTTLRLDDATMLPQMIVAYPGRLLYNYMVEENVTGLKDCVKEFAAGYTGTISRPEGSIIEFSGGEAVITIANQGETGRIVCSGDVRVTRLAQADANRDNTLAIGNFEVLFKDHAQAVVKTLILSELAAGYEATLIVEDQASIQVTGTSNVDANTASIMVGHWDGPSTLILRDEARLVAEGADMLVGLTSNNQTIILEGGELRVRGVVLSRNASDTNTLNLVGGRLTLGATGIKRAPNANTTLAMTVKGGSIGAFEDFTLGAMFEDMATVTIEEELSFKGSATVTLSTAALLQENIQVLGGALKLEGNAFSDYDALTVNNGQMIVAGGLNLVVETMTMENATVTFAGGTITSGELVLGQGSLFEIPVVANLADSGYLVVAEGKTIGDLSKLGIMATLDPNRLETDRLLPNVPVVLGATDAATKAPVALSTMNNSNNAIETITAEIKETTLGEGIYLVLTGFEVFKDREPVKLTQTPTFFTQANASITPYTVFEGTAQDENILALPEEGLKLYQVEFIGEAITLKAQGETPHTLLQVNGATIGTDLTFDLTPWTDALLVAAQGAVTDVPVSFCLVAGGSNLAAGKTLSVRVDQAVTDRLTAMGITAEVVRTQAGLYYVLSADRAASTLSVNFTNAATPLVAPPATFGAYAIDVTEWTSLTASYSTPELFITDRVGMKGVQAKRGDVATRLVSSTSVSRTDTTNPTALQVWTNDAGAVTLTVENIPFDAYRVALIFAADMADAAFACATVNGQRYAMDAEGYTRANIVDYVDLNGNGSTNFFVAGDSAWGQTKTDAIDTLGVNALVTDVFVTTDADATAVITLPALIYKQVYAGVAALQVIEAPAFDASVETDYTYTFTAAGAYDLMALADDNGQTWVNGAQHKLTLTSTADDLVTVTLPYGFTAKTVTLNGKAFTLATPEKTALQLSTLDATAVETLTLSAAVVGEVLPPTVKLTVEAPMENNGQPFTIPAGLTLVLTEDSKMSTNFDSAAPRLTINPASEGTLRCNYPVVYSTDIVNNTLTFAWQDFVSTRTNASFRGHLLIEEGDAFSCNASLSVPNKDGLTAGFTGLITQRGGLFSVKGGTHGLLLGSNDRDAKSLDYVLNLEGGRFEADKLTLWTTQGATFTANVTQGTFAIGALNVRQTNGKFALNLSENGVFELMGSLATNNPTALVFNGGTLASSLQDVTLGLPAIFAGTDVAPTMIDLEATSTLVLNAVNTGSGTIEVPQGTLAISNASALGSATVTIGSGAAYEVRGLAADAVITGTVTFEKDALLKITNTAITTGTVKIAGTIADASETPLLLLNGTAYAVTMDKANGTITIGAAVGVSDLTWTNTVDEGLWSVGVATPWTSDEAFKNGDNVIFPTKSVDIDGINVKVRGTVAPASMTMTGVVNTDGYVFTEDGTGVIDLTALEPVENKIQLQLGAGVVYDVPIKTDASTTNSQIVFANSPANTYRLIGAFDSTGKVASLFNNEKNLNEDNASAMLNIDGEITFAPHAGETQELSASINVFRGNGLVTVKGGGTVRFPGNVNNHNYNSAFNGAFAVSEASVLEFAFTRGDLTTPYFVVGADDPLWKKAAEDGAVNVGFTLTNGGQLRFSGAPTVLAGTNQVNQALVVKNHPIVIGTNAMVEYRTQNEYTMPYGLIFNGDEATLQATTKTSIATGASLIVSGVGDKGDLTDPKTNTTWDDEAYGTLTEGILAKIEGQIATTTSTVGPAVELVVGEGSTLAMAAEVVDQGTFAKVGPGRLSLDAAMWSAPAQITVREGCLGGRTAMGSGAQVIMHAGTTIEAGLSMGSLVLEKNEDGTYATMAIDPTGAKLLRADVVSFTERATYAIEALPGVVVPTAVTQLPIQVVAWSSAQHADSATFILSEALTQAGYGLLVREDGLYLAKRVVYKRMLDGVTSETTLVAMQWHTKEWMRDNDPTLVNFAPAEGEAVEVQWILPQDIPSTMVLKMELTLDREVEFATMRVLRGEGGDEVNANVTYVYNLVNETMPEYNEVATFTWVPTLLVNANGTATVTASSYPSDYDIAIAKATVTLYRDSTAPVLNISFGEAHRGDTAWISDGSAPCGAVPFAGAHWNNASTATDGSVDLTNGIKRYSTKVTVDGLTDTEDENAGTVYLEYIASASNTVLSRTNTPNGVLTSTYIAGAQFLPAEMTLGVQASWMVSLDKVPFKTYDIYLVFAGDTDNTVVDYSAVAVKVGEAPWRPFAYIVNEDLGSWTAPAVDTWSGLASPQEGALIHGKHYLRLRVLADTKGAPLQVAGFKADAKVGLAAIQVVECDDGPIMYAVGSSWSDANAWQREAANGDVDRGAWVDASELAPRPAVIENRTMNVDKPAVMPYLQVKGTVGSTIKGVEDYLRTSVVDLTSATGSVTFEDDVFVASPMVIMGESQRLTLPEAETGTIVNDWRWIYPSGVTGNGSTLAKVKGGDLVLKHYLHGAWEIAAGTLWADFDTDVTHGASISGLGAFAKKGARSLTLTGALSLAGEATGTPIRVEGGLLNIDASNGLTGIGSGKTLVATTGATLQFNANKGAANQTTLVADGGTLHMTGNFGTNATTTIRLENGGTLRATAGATGGSAIRNLIVRGKGNRTDINLGAGYGSGLTVLNDFILEAGATLEHHDGHGALRLPSRKMTIGDGATFSSHRSVGVGQPGWYTNPDTQSLQKYGPGLWETYTALGSKGDGPAGNALEIYEGEVRFALGGGTYNPNRTDKGAWIQVKNSATVSGNVNFGEQVPVTVEQGGIISSGVPGNATSKITVHSLTLEDGAIVACDLSKNKDACLTVTDMLSATKNLTVKLTNYGTSLTEARRLITWPETMATAGLASVVVDSAEAVALDATFEWVTTGTADAVGLWLKPAGTNYKRTVTGEWSDALWQLPAGGGGAFVTNASARFNITDDVTVTLDQADTVAAFLMDVAKGKTLTLANDGQDTPAKLTIGHSNAKGSLWKLSEGTAIVEAPLNFVNTDNFHVALGRLTLTKPFTYVGAVPPFPMVIERGATLTLDLGTEVQKLSDNLSGAGTLEVVSGDVTVGNGNAAKDHDVNYIVADGATLAINQAIEASTRTAARTVSVGKGATLTLNQNRALGSTPNLTMTLADTATVECDAPSTEYGAHLGGAIVVPEGTATIAGDVKVINDLTYTIGEGATLTLQGGVWTMEADAAVSIAKTGVGTLVLDGGYTLGSVPFEIASGVVAIEQNVSTHASAQPLVTVKEGATLVLAQTLQLDAGSLVVEPKARLVVVEGLPAISGGAKLSRDAVVAFEMANNRLPTLQLTRVELGGVVTIELPEMPSQNLPASYVLMEATTTTGLAGSGSFRLGGVNAAAWIEAGWTLRQTNNQLLLVSATSADTYVWGALATDDAATWTNGDYWYQSTSMREPTAWNPTGDPWSVMLKDVVTVKTDASEEELSVKRRLEWADIKPFEVTALRSDAMGTNGYTIAQTGKADASLAVYGEMVLTGDATTTFECPVYFGPNASLSLLKGVLRLEGGLQQGSVLSRPIAMGDEAVIEFAGTKNVSLASAMTCLREAEDATLGTFVNSGTGVITFASDISKVKAFEASNGTFAMAQDNLFTVATPVTLTDKKATFSFAGQYTGSAGEAGDAIRVKINENAAVPAGVLDWSATGNAAVATTPRLTSKDGMANVETFRYASKEGRLTLEADGFFPETTTLRLATTAVESRALLLGKGRTGVNPKIVFGHLTGADETSATAGIIGVEPALNATAGEWSTHRVLTLKLMNASSTFGGCFMGASVNNTTIKAGLAIDRADDLDATFIPRFTYTGTSTSKLGTFSIAKDTRAEILGTWAGDVKVAEGGRLTGNGTIGATDAVVNVPAGACISAVTYQANKMADVPTVMPIAGTLKLEQGSIIEVLVAMDDTDAPVISCIEAKKVQLPNIVEGDEVKLNVVVRLPEAGDFAMNQKILGWEGLNGSSKVNGNVTVLDHEGNEVTGVKYYLRQKSDGLYLTRSKSRTWLIIR